MARPTVTWRAALFSTTNSGSPYSAAPTWTPGANSLIVAFVGSCLASSAPDPTSVSAHGVSLTKVAAGIVQGTVTLSVWVGDAGASPTSAAAAATISGSPTGCVIDEFEVTNWNTAAGAIAAILQINSATGSATSGSVPVRLVAQTVNESAYVSCFIHLVNETSTGQGGNWTATAGGTGNFNTPATGAIGQHNNTGYTATATASWTTSGSYVGLVIEIQGTTEVSPSESLKVQDQTPTGRLNPYPLSIGSEDLKCADTVVNAFTSTDLSVVVSSEVCRPRDFIYGASRVAGDLSAGLAEITIAVVDGGAALQRGIVQLLGVLHVVDGPAQLSIDPERPTIGDEVLKLADGPVSARLNPDPILLGSENLKIQDTVTADGLGNAISVVVESEILHLNDQPPFIEERLKIQDTVTAAFAGGDLSRNVGDETLKLKDGGVSTQMGIVQLLGVLHVQDQGPQVSLSSSGLAVNVSELLHVQDGLPVPELSDKYVSLTETLYLDDSGLVVTPGKDELLHVVDILVAVVENPLIAAPLDEAVKVQDTVTTLENPLRGEPATENLKVQDTVSASTGGLSVLVTQEALKVQDTVTVLENPLQAAPSDEPVKVQDTVTVLENPLQAAAIDESVKVQDTVTVSENPLFAAPATENIKVQDTVVASTGGLIAVVADEVLKVQDTVTVSENPLFAAPALENVKVQDTATVVEDALISAPAVENLKVQDTVTVVENPLIASPATENLKVQDTVIASSGGLVAPVTDEVLKVQDSASTLLNPEFAAPALENLKISDTVTVALQLAVSVGQESLKVQDTVTAALQLATSVADESLKISDSASGTLTVLPVVVGSENLKVQDVVSLGVDLLSVNVTAESLKLRDVYLVPATPRVIVHVRPRGRTVRKR